MLRRYNLGRLELFRCHIINTPPHHSARTKNNTRVLKMIARTTRGILAAALVGGAFSMAQVPPAEAGQKGAASWYGPGFHGRKTASGERFNTHAMTAAHKTLAFGTRVRVTNEKTGRAVVVRINDRGPYAHGRIIDLSQASARAIGIGGVGKVSLSQL
jgi:rare lipoprotein A